eukprot:scaffold143_cov364-Pavlova_lutheri.AAC.4
MDKPYLAGAIRWIRPSFFSRRTDTKYVLFLSFVGNPRPGTAIFHPNFPVPQHKGNGVGRRLETAQLGGKGVPPSASPSHSGTKWWDPLGKTERNGS